MVQPEREPCFHGIRIIVCSRLYQRMLGMLRLSACVCSHSRINIRSLLVVDVFSRDDDVTGRNDVVLVPARGRGGRAVSRRGTVDRGLGVERPSPERSEPVSSSTRLETSLSSAESSLTSSLASLVLVCDVIASVVGS